MSDLINFILTYLNPIYLFNLLWDLVIDAFYLIIQMIVDTLTGLLAIVNWITPSFPDLAPPQIVVDIAKFSAWVIPWHYAFLIVTLMITLTVFAISTTWILRWIKVIK